MYDHYRPLYVESTCTILTCTSEEFQEKYNDANLDTSVLCDDLLLNTIGSTGKYYDELVAACDQYHLDKLLEGMLNYAPTPAGKRYVAISLYIAHRKGADAVINVAKAWLDHLFLMMQTISRASEEAPSGSQTPTIDDTLIQIDKATRADQADLTEKLRVREGFRCALTHVFDRKRAEELYLQNKYDEVPDGVQYPMAAAHIIPFLLHDFVELEGAQGSASMPRDRAHTCDMFRSWTNINIGPNIITPANTILMTTIEHQAFVKFQIYFDKDAFPNENKYKVRWCNGLFRLSNGRSEADVEFPTLEASGIDPPDPEFLRIHAAFAKVLHLCGATDVMDQLERDSERGIPLPTSMILQDVSRRLAILAM